jgi:hypothetical protein
VRSDVSSASGHQYLHVAILLSPTTMSELPNGAGNALRVFCSKRDTWKRILFAQADGTLGASGSEPTTFSMTRTPNFTGHIQ